MCIRDSPQGLPEGARRQGLQGLGRGLGQLPDAAHRLLGRTALPGQGPHPFKVPGIPGPAPEHLPHLGLALHEEEGDDGGLALPQVPAHGLA